METELVKATQELIYMYMKCVQVLMQKLGEIVRWEHCVLVYSGNNTRQFLCQEFKYPSSPLHMAPVASLPQDWVLLCSDCISYPTLLKLCDHRHVFELCWSVVKCLY